MGKLWNLLYAICAGIFVMLFTDIVARYFCAEDRQAILYVDIVCVIFGAAAAIYFIRHPEV